MNRFERSAPCAVSPFGTVGFLRSAVDIPDMDGPRVVLVALLLCLAPFGGLPVAATGDVAPAQDAPPETQNQQRSMSVVTAGNTSEYLAPDSVDRSGQLTASIDVAGAVSSDAGELRSAFRQDALERAFRNAETDAERRDVLRNGTRDLVERVDGLERTQDRAITAYGSGEIDQTRLLRTLAVVDSEARSIETTREWLESRANQLDVEETSDRLSTLEVRLVTLQGPVRERVDFALIGNRPIRVHAAVTGGGVVLSMIEGGGSGDLEYVREAYDPSAGTKEVGDRYNGDPTAALERIEVLYPWVTNNTFGAVNAIGPAQHRVYRFAYDHPHGDLETYLDSGSGEILLERQFKRPRSVPTRTSATTANGLRLEVAKTYPSGPLGVAVNDTTSNQRVDAAIEVNGESVGRTDGGRLWTVAPRGDLTINATHGSRNVTLQTTLS